MKFVHTADWQIGMRAAHTGGAAERVRQERLHAARRVVEAARAHGAEFLLVAGDTFEDNGVDRALVREVGEILATFGGPVYILPGNHDPVAPGSVWEHRVWCAPQLHVLSEAEPVAIEGGTLFPCPARAKKSPDDPTAWIAEAARAASPGSVASGPAGFRIGLAHGNVEGIQQGAPDFPIPRDAAARGRLDYLALGHWHSFATFPGAAGAIRMAYSATHEQTKFGEREAGQALLIEIDVPSAPPRLTPLTTGGLTWIQIDRDLRLAGELAAIQDEIERLADPATTLLEIRLTGLLHAEDGMALGQIEELCAARRFLCHRIDASGLRPVPGDGAWIEQLPAGVVRAAGRRLLALAAPANGHPAASGATRPETAALALLELYALAAADGGGVTAPPPEGANGAEAA